MIYSELRRNLYSGSRNISTDNKIILSDIKIKKIDNGDVGDIRDAGTARCELVCHFFSMGAPSGAWIPG